MRVGISGYGLAGRVFHGPLLKGCGFEVASILTSNPERMAQAKSDFPEALTFSELDAFLDSGLDLVVIASSNVAHLPQTRAALERKIPTVVDKPTEVIEQPLPAPKQPVVITVAEVDETADVAPTQVDNLSTVPDTQVGFAPPSVTKDLQEVLDDEFQVLFFKVAGLTLAVPLVSLGGIVKVERINHIIGRPSWFLGVQTHREEQLNLVDTCAWVMPEKYTDKLAQSVNYQYLVLLEGSNWGLTCESLVNAVKINKSQVNWRSQAGKRPWLAGVVKEQMCGILHVQALVEMLDAGLGCQDSIG